MSEELTREDVRKIEAEIQKRKLEIRPKLIEAVKEARAQGFKVCQSDFHKVGRGRCGN